ncbi:hypothetical protein OHB26_32680 [Nocardia sp. NBC_01503]|uniref:hypothetical protein n=1 Tax=Nocardia sp. NBC_01503 TaxID=2975997 RepID=UPI002E7B3C23|nr:hypothetical protein [Nocardia sp. NBC_01503]WTL31616.1 hypothetical protein OHB26_32680 [Nocardia sp. NBC_01503]
MLAHSARITLAALGATIALTSGAGLAHADAPAPSPEELQSTLDRFVDPTVATVDKEQLMVSGERRASNIDTMTSKLGNYGKIGFGVSNIQVDGDNANASVAIISPHGTMPGVPMSWQHTAAGWQLSENTGCTILSMGRAPC